MSRIVVSGGAGFIGSHLVESLIAAGNEVICVDNFHTGTKRNIHSLRDNERFECIRHDVVESILIEADEIYHLACPASPVHYQSNPIKTIKTNVLGTINLLGLAKRIKAKFLLASTSEVYGDPLEHPQSEHYWGNVNPIGPRSCYDEGKRVAESLTVNYLNQSHVDTKIVRIFNTYGPRMLFNDGRVVSNFVVQALEGKDITVYGKGDQTRSFCFVDDMVAGLIATMNSEGFHGPVNLGNPVEMTIVELAETIIKLTNSKSKIVYKDLPQDDPMRRRPNIELAKSKLNWEPKVDLETGLKRTIADFAERMKDAS